MKETVQLQGVSTEELVYPPSALRDLQRVVSPDGFVSASDHHLYRSAFFGRDATELAEDLVHIYPEITRGVILNLARLQGVGYNPVTEEEPGRIHHEYRSLSWSGKRINRESEKIFRFLFKKWGGEDNQLTYYGTVDATPLYVNLVADYCKRYGTDILTTEIEQKNGEKITIGDSVFKATDWIESRMRTSDLGLIEFQTTNKKGLAIQAWKDSDYAYIHETGEPANIKAPIAPIEVQSYAYDALTKAAGMFRNAHPEKAERWTQLANYLQTAVFEKFWVPEREYFAMGLDRDKNGTVRQIKTVSSNPALLLSTGVFDSPDEETKKEYISAIVKKIYSDEFITPVGLRCRSTLHKYLIHIQDYHGVWAVWPKETYDVAKGLEKQGFPRLADQLETRILNGINISGNNFEFFYVSPEGYVEYDPEEKRMHLTPQQIIDGTNYPENIQAWTVSAALAIKYKHAHPQPRQIDTQSWQYQLEENLLQKVPWEKLLKSREELKKAFPTDYSFRIDLTLGLQKENLLRHNKR